MQTTITGAELSAPHASVVPPGSFEPQEHFYPKVLNAQIHPIVAFFLRMENERIVNRYCHLNPRVDPDYLLGLLSQPPKYFRWSGADLFHTTTAAGDRRMVVIETNSCPSGNKSMPITSEDNDQGGFRTLLETSFMPLLKRATVSGGRLAVIYDKNFTEVSGYAAALADLAKEDVFLAPLPASVADSSAPRAAEFRDGILEVRAPDGSVVPIRAAFRYVTQKPWMRIPVRSRTRLLNPIIACLAGGRNKLIAAKAYDLFNAEIAPHGLQVQTPETIPDVRKAEIPLWVRRFGGHAVIKNPYSNAGQGVYTIVSQAELDRFMEGEYAYDKFIVQSLVGNYAWSSDEKSGRYYHVGTMPDRKGRIYVADLRMMTAAGPNGFRPVSVYARRARSPLPASLNDSANSWEVLGTNLSERAADGGWAAQTQRLMLMDRRDFNQLGVGVDGLIGGYIQTVLATLAIDRMAQNLISTKGGLRMSLFRSLNNDDQLVEEIEEARAMASLPKLRDSK